MFCCRLGCNLAVGAGEQQLPPQPLVLPGLLHPSLLLGVEC